MAERRTQRVTEEQNLRPGRCATNGYAAAQTEQANNPEDTEKLISAMSEGRHSDELSRPWQESITRDDHGPPWPTRPVVVTACGATRQRMPRRRASSAQTPPRRCGH